MFYLPSYLQHLAHYVEILGFQYMNESMNSMYTLMLMMTGIRGIGVQEYNKQKPTCKTSIHLFKDNLLMPTSFVHSMMAQFLLLILRASL